MKNANINGNRTSNVEATEKVETERQSHSTASTVESDTESSWTDSQTLY